MANIIAHIGNAKRPGDRSPGRFALVFLCAPFLHSEDGLWRPPICPHVDQMSRRWLGYFRDRRVAVLLKPTMRSSGESAIHELHECVDIVPDNVEAG